LEFRDGLLFKEFGVRADPCEDDDLIVAFSIDPVYQQVIAVNVALTVVLPFSGQFMVPVLRWQRGVIGNQKTHDILRSAML